MDVELADVLNGGDGPGRIANRSPWCAPHGIYPAAGEDRWVAIACRDDGERAALEAVIGGPLDDETISAWTCRRSREAIVGALRAAAVPVSGVDDMGDLHEDAAVRALWTAMELPSGVVADVLNEPIVWDGERLPLRRAPIWMEHTYEVLVDELQLDPARFVELLEAKVLW
jgi:crotonobetainyl-CoA:carnitine CoA-transferase CaiB-like acyl-CoA transferase